MASDTPDLNKLMAELLSAHKETEHHAVRMMQRQSESEASWDEFRAALKQMTERQEQMAERQIDLESLTKQVAENNIRLSRILEAHDYDIEEMDARLLRLEERRRNGS